MHMGALAINANVDCKNLVHIIFNNGAHDSVGGQPTVAHKISISSAAKSFGYHKVLIAKNEDEIKKSIKDLKASKGVCLLEIIINKGFRPDLGRPTRSPLKNKEDIMNFLK